MSKTIKQIAQLEKKLEKLKAAKVKEEKVLIGFKVKKDGRR